MTNETQLEDIKQIIVVRKDLNMRKGKMMAQAAHASQLAVFSFARVFNDSEISFYLLNWEGQQTAFGKWMTKNFKKIVVGVNSEQELLDIYEQAKSKNIACGLVQDSGLTEFKGVKTYTAVGIGPDTSENLEFTRHLTLL